MPGGRHGAGVVADRAVRLPDGRRRGAVLAEGDQRVAGGGVGFVAELRDAAADEDPVRTAGRVGDDRRGGDRVAGESFDLPKLRAVGGVVAGDAAGGADDDQPPAAGGRDDGRRPRLAGRAVDLPQRLAGRLSDGDQVRRAVVFDVEVNRVGVLSGGAAEAVVVLHAAELVCERTRPDKVPVVGEGAEVAGLPEGVDALAVQNRRRGGAGVRVVVDGPLRRVEAVFPEPLAGLQVVAEEQAGLLPVALDGGEEDAAAGDDGRGLAVAGGLGLPKDVVLRGPADGEVALGPGRPAVAEAGPVGGGEGGGGREEGRGGEGRWSHAVPS